MDDIARLAVFTFQKGTANEPPPIRILLGPRIPGTLERPGVTLATLHAFQVAAELVTLIVLDTLYQFLVQNSHIRKQMPVQIFDASGNDVILKDVVVAHGQRLPHQAIQVGTALHGNSYTLANQQT